VSSVTKALESAQSQRGTAFTALVIALGTSLWGASGAFGAVGRALNVVWRVEEGRNFVRKKLYDLGWTLALLVLILLTFVLIFVGGDVAHDLLGKIGLGALADGAWPIARWPAALVLAMLVYAIVYYAAPNVEVRASSSSPRGGGRRGGVDRGVGRVLLLRLELLVLLGHLRRVRGRGDPARVAVADQRGAAAGRRAQRGDRHPALARACGRRYDGPAAAGQGPGRAEAWQARPQGQLLGVGAERLAAGAVAAEARWGSAATGWRCSRTPSARLVSCSASAGMSFGVKVAVTGASGRSRKA
jgi:hypothetical protein